MRLKGRRSLIFFRRHRRESYSYGRHIKYLRRNRALPGATAAAAYFTRVGCLARGGLHLLTKQGRSHKTASRREGAASAAILTDDMSRPDADVELECEMFRKLNIYKSCSRPSAYRSSCYGILFANVKAKKVH